MSLYIKIRNNLNAILYPRMAPTTWPPQENCTTITISKYTESRDQAESTKTIDDQSTMDTIFKYLHTIPAHGDEIKMGMSRQNFR